MENSQHHQQVYIKKDDDRQQQREGLSNLLMMSQQSGGRQQLVITQEVLHLGEVRDRQYLSATLCPYPCYGFGDIQGSAGARNDSAGKNQTCSRAKGRNVSRE
jgi:hypothetical protein